METLKPCPFCGTETDLEIIDDPDGRPIVRCMVCDCFGPGADFGTTWNDRKPPVEVTGLTDGRVKK